MFYTVSGSSSQAFGIILGEALSLSKFGDLTLRELILLAGMSMAFLKKATPIPSPIPSPQKEES